MNLKKNLVYNFLLSASQVLFPLITIPYISRVLDPEGIGNVAFIDSFTYFFTIIAEFGIVSYGVREIARVGEDPVARSKVIAELLYIQFIASFIALVLYGAGLLLFWQKIGDYRLVLFSAAFFLFNFIYCEWYFWGRERFQYISVRSIVIRVLSIAAIFLLIHNRQDFLTYYAIMVISAMAILVSNAVILFRENRIQFQLLEIRKHLKPLWVNFSISLVYSVSSLLDVPIVRLAAGIYAAGIYMMTLKITRLISALLTDLFLVLYPYSVRISTQSEKAAFHTRLLHFSQLILSISLPACCGMYIISGDFIHLFLGTSFSSVAPNLRIVCVFPAIVSFSLFLNKQVLMVHDKENLVLKGLLIGNLLFLPAAIYAATFYSDQGACIALVIAELVILLANFYHCRKLLPEIQLLDFGFLLKLLPGILLFFPLKWWIDQWGLKPIPHLIAVIGILSIFYCSWTFWISKPVLLINVVTHYLKSSK